MIWLLRQTLIDVSPASVDRVKPRRGSERDGPSVEFHRAGDARRVRYSPHAVRTDGLCHRALSSARADGGSARPNRPRRLSVSRSGQLRPYESSYFRCSAPSSAELRSMFTDFEALLCALPGPAFLRPWLENFSAEHTIFSGWPPRAARELSGTVTTTPRDLGTAPYVSWTCGRTDLSVRNESPGRVRG